MAQIINTNLMSLNAQRNLTTTQSSLATSIQRLSTGLRVNSAKDDAAGIAIADRMNAQVRGMNVGIRNANDAISLAQTAEGALGKVGDMAQRMRELAVQSANATNSPEDRANLDLEFQELGKEITRTLEGTKFNGKTIFGADAGALTFQVGAGATATDQIVLTSTQLVGHADVTKVTGSDGTPESAPGAGDAVVAQVSNIKATKAADGTVVDGSDPLDAIVNIDKLLDTINTQRASFGAAQNRFEAAIATQQVAVENQSAARSRIMDADFAAETAALTRAQVLQQAGTAMLSQANSIPNNVLSLLR